MDFRVDFVSRCNILLTKSLIFQISFGDLTVVPNPRGVLVTIPLLLPTKVAVLPVVFHPRFLPEVFCFIGKLGCARMANILYMCARHSCRLSSSTPALTNKGPLLLLL